jgi:hypothetical protein
MRDLLSSGAGPRDTGKIAQQNVATGEVSGRCLPGGSLQDITKLELGVRLDNNERMNTAAGNNLDVLSATNHMYTYAEFLCHFLTDSRIATTKTAPVQVIILNVLKICLAIKVELIVIQDVLLQTMNIV